VVELEDGEALPALRARLASNWSRGRKGDVNAEGHRDPKPRILVGGRSESLWRKVAVGR
jgi:hypothetical protein